MDIESDVICLGGLLISSTLQGDVVFVGHDVGCQDCDKAPAFELAPEQRMSFCWFQPEGPLRLRLRLGSQELLGRRFGAGEMCQLAKENDPFQEANDLRTGHFPCQRSAI